MLPHTCCNNLSSFTTAFQILKQAKKQPEFRPEAAILSIHASRLWKKISNPLFKEIKQSFDLDDKGSVDRKKQTKIKALADTAVKEFSKQLKPKASKMFKVVQNKAFKHYTKQFKNPPKKVKPAKIKKAEDEKDEELLEFQDFLLAVGILQMLAFIEEYPKRLLLPGVEKLTKTFELKLIDRGINFTQLTKQLQNYQAKTQQYMAQLTDVFTARQWHFMGIQMLYTAGFAQYQYIAQMDKATCPVCYSDKTRVMTQRGLIFFKDIDIKTDLFLSLNPDSLDTEWVKATDAQIHKYKGNLIEFRRGPKLNARKIMQITPNHTIFYRKYNSDRHTYTSKFGSIEKFKSSRHFQLYKSSEYIGDELDTVGIPGATYNRDLFLKFIAYYLADGSKHHYYVRIAQCKEKSPHFKEIYNNLSLLFKDVRVYENSIYIKENGLKTYCDQFGSFKDKFIPNWVHDSSKRQLNVFLDAMTITDGHRSKRGDVTFYTSSPKLRDDLCKIILMAGFAPSFTTRFDKNEITILGKKTKQTCPNYVIIKSSIKNSSTLQSNIKYNGMVYDITLEKYHTLLTELNGAFYWGSNCQRLHGRIFSVPLAKKKMDKFLQMKDPEAMKNFYPFPRVNLSAWQSWRDALNKK